MSNKRILALVLALVVFMLLAVPAERGAARTTLYVTIYCLSSGHGHMVCQADVSGGTGSYTYNWMPPPNFGSGPSMVCNCSPYRYQTVSLTVTDSNGATGSDITTAFCGNAQ